MLRPTVERLETIYSTASTQQATPGPAGHLMTPSQATRQSSLNRKQSRAERSAAKNIADAKRRGWRRSKSKRRKMKELNFDTANSAAWTDVTGSSRGMNTYHVSVSSEQRGKGGKMCCYVALETEERK